MDDNEVQYVEEEYSPEEANLSDEECDFSGFLGNSVGFNNCHTDSEKSDESDSETDIDELENEVTEESEREESSSEESDMSQRTIVQNSKVNFTCNNEFSAENDSERDLIQQEEVNQENYVNSEHNIEQACNDENHSRSNIFELSEENMIQDRVLHSTPQRNREDESSDIGSFEGFPSIQDDKNKSEDQLFQVLQQKLAMKNHSRVSAEIVRFVVD